MAASVNADVLNAALDEIEQNGTVLSVCSSEPTTYTEATDTYELANATISATDMTKGAGDVDGRKLTISEQADLDVDTSGTATHIAISDASGTRLLLVTTCTSQELSDTGTVTVPTWDYTVRQPVAS